MPTRNAKAVSNDNQVALPVKPTKKQADVWLKAAEEYIANCVHFDIKIDPSIVIALRTGWKKLRPSKEVSTEGCMLPLLGVLNSNEHITDLCLDGVSVFSGNYYRSVGNGNSNARILNFILRDNEVIKELNLRQTGLDDDGLVEICEAIAVNKSLTSLNLGDNRFGERGSEALQSALKLNNSLKELDLSNNSLGFDSIRALECQCISSALSLKKQGNFVFEEILNATSHGVAFLLSIVACIVLMHGVYEVNHSTDYHYWSCLVYSFSLMFLFLFSTLYHSFFMMPGTHRVFQILDNIGIYMLIAGSYTPVVLIGLHNSFHARMLLICEWLCAFFASLFAIAGDLNHPLSQQVKLGSFIVMGFACFTIMPQMYEILPKDAVILLLGGGLTYVCGIVFFIMGERVPIYHTVWHMFVLVAAVLQWFAIYFYVLSIDIHLTEGIENIIQGAINGVQDIQQNWQV
jgi:hemolysin III